MNYYEKLKDPRWQKKRLEIFKMANFACSSCGDNKSSLHVHHSFYKKGADPWDYENDTLYCLCEECHKDAQNTLNECHYELGLLSPEFLKPVAITCLCDILTPYISNEELIKSLRLLTTEKTTPNQKPTPGTARIVTALWSISKTGISNTNTGAKGTPV